jgi:fibronectin type 3 domain-containing protein
VRSSRRHGIAVAGLLAGCMASCGYPGEPLPPALSRPNRVADLAAVERGSKIYVQFTVPSTTTEGLPIKGKPDIELRVGPMPADGFTWPKYEKSSERVPEAAIEVDKLHASAQVDASKLYGKTVLLAVRVHGSHGQDIGWSRIETLDLVPALAMPEALVASDAPDAVHLDWHAAAPEFRVFRKGPEETAFKQIGTSDKPSYSDTTIEYGKTYDYLVQSVQKGGERYAESEPSAAIAFKPIDKFPPAVPAGLTPVPGSRSIELVWDRNTERDFAAYQVYRDGKKIADGLTAPAYSDRDVKAGAQYRYQVSATDTAGNQSAQCSAVQTAIP